MPLKHIDKRREYARQWMAKRRADYFADKQCSKCNSTSNLELVRTDTAELSRAVWSLSEKKRSEAIQECIVLCAGCRKAKVNAENRERFTKEIVHGTLAGYEKKGCRCDLCSLAKKKARKKQAANRKRRATIAKKKEISYLTPD